MAWSALALAAALAFAGFRSGNPSPSDSPSLTPVPTKGGGLGRDAQPADSQSTTNRAEADPLVLPTSGRIHSVHPGLQFVVVDYTLGGIPPLQSILHVYRDDQKVGEIRLTGPERNGFVAADVLEGVLRNDDEVRIH